MSRCTYFDAECIEDCDDICSRRAEPPTVALPPAPVTLSPDVLAVLKAATRLSAIPLHKLSEIPAGERGDFGLGVMALDFALAGLSPEVRALLESDNG